MDYRILAGQRIKAAREATFKKDGKRLTQDDLKELVPELSGGRLGNYEQGQRYPPPEILVSISRWVNEPPEYLSGLIPDGPYAELVRAFHKMDDVDQEDVLHYVKRRKSLVVATPSKTVDGVETTTRERRKKAR